MDINLYEDKLSVDYENFLKTCINSTFLHSRAFLSYHKNKFCDKTVILKEKNKIIGVLPAAEDLNDSKAIVSHPGLTYGGFLHDGNLKGEKMINAFQEVINFYKRSSFDKLIYKSIPLNYFKTPCQDDLYALSYLKAKKFRTDLSSVIYLKNRLSISSRRKRGYKKSIKNNIVIDEGDHLLPEVWSILEENLKNKYKTQPTHSLEEIKSLIKLFPEEIEVFASKREDRVLAGVVVFHTYNTSHCQYITSSSEGQDLSASDLLFEKLIGKCVKEKKSFFSFGSSTENQGTILNSDLYKFKSEFGAGGIIQDFYDLSF